MFKIFLFLVLLLELGTCDGIMVIGDKNFPDMNLSKQDIKAIFLDKKRFLNNQKILAMNYEYGNELRVCFEKSILEKSQKSLERYWRKAYYKGKKPPKIIKSIEMLFSYIESVSPSIGYIDANTTLKEDVKILFESQCS